MFAVLQCSYFMTVAVKYNFNCYMQEFMCNELYCTTLKKNGQAFIQSSLSFFFGYSGMFF